MKKPTIWLEADRVSSQEDEVVDALSGGFSALRFSGKSDGQPRSKGSVQRIFFNGNVMEVGNLNQKIEAEKFVKKIFYLYEKKWEGIAIIDRPAQAPNDTEITGTKIVV